MLYYAILGVTHPDLLTLDPLERSHLDIIHAARIYHREKFQIAIYINTHAVERHPVRRAYPN